MRAPDCLQDAAKLDGMNKEFISFLFYLTESVLFLPNCFVDLVVLVETNRRIKVPDLEFGAFLRFIGVYLLMK